MPTVAVHPPKTPVTKGSNSISAATIPNVCKMPGPPAPFVPTPLPNIGRSGIGPKGYSKSVKIEGNAVAIAGASFGSIGDIASKATGGGILSNNCEGPTKFIAPGSLTVQIEGKNIQLLSDVMSNNNGPAGSPPNAATLMGTIHVPSMPDASVAQFLKEIACRCDKKRANNYKDGSRLSCNKAGTEKHACCEDALQRHKEKGGPPKCGGEQGYDGAGKQVSPPGRDAHRAAGTLGGTKWPDAAALGGDGKPTQLFDFKFKCKHAKSSYPGPPSWSSSPGNARQSKKYKQLSRQLGINPKKKPPKIVHNQGC